MHRVFFDELALPGAQYKIDVGSGTHTEQTGKIMMGVERVLEKEHTDMVLIKGDTNTVMVGALEAVILHKHFRPC